jgi:tRNA(His) guanylyltransferase
MDSLGDRMKNNYEKIFMNKLPERMPVIIRLDGKAFHTLTGKYFKTKPFDLSLIEIMNDVSIELCKKVQGCQLAYAQSDEISLLLHNYKKFNTCSWFNNEIQKITSISASIASAIFTKYLIENKINDIALFDSRVFVLPENEVCNYYIWRQQDWTRNSIQMATRALYSEKECYKKTQPLMQEMLFEKGINWNNYATFLKRGRCIIKKDNQWVLDNHIPIFTENRQYIEKLLECEEK